MPRVPSTMPHVRLCSWLQRLMRRRRTSVQRSLLLASIRLMSLSSLSDVVSLKLNQTTRSARSAFRDTSHTSSSGLLIYRLLFTQLERPFNASEVVIDTLATYAVEHNVRWYQRRLHRRDSFRPHWNHQSSRDRRFRDVHFIR